MSVATVRAMAGDAPNRTKRGTETDPVAGTERFVTFAEAVENVRGLLHPDDQLDRDLRDLDDAPDDPFA